MKTNAKIFMIASFSIIFLLSSIMFLKNDPSNITDNSILKNNPSGITGYASYKGETKGGTECCDLSWEHSRYNKCMHGGNNPVCYEECCNKYWPVDHYNICKEIFPKVKDCCCDPSELNEADFADCVTDDSGIQNFNGEDIYNSEKMCVIKCCDSSWLSENFGICMSLLGRSCTNPIVSLDVVAQGINIYILSETTNLKQPHIEVLIKAYLDRDSITSDDFLLMEDAIGIIRTENEEKVDYSLLY